MVRDSDSWLGASLEDSRLNFHGFSHKHRLYKARIQQTVTLQRVHRRCVLANVTCLENKKLFLLD